MDEGENLLYSTGFKKPLRNVTLMDVSPIIKALLDYHLMVKVKASADQFIEGLEIVGFLIDLRNDPLLWQEYFTYRPDMLTAGMIDMQL